MLNFPIVCPWHFHTRLLSSSSFKQILKETSSTPTWKLCTRKVSTNLPVHLRGNSSCWTPSFNAWACKKPLRKPLIRWFVEAATSKTKRKPKQRGFFFWGGVTFSGFNTLVPKPSCNTRSNKNLEILIKIWWSKLLTLNLIDWLTGKVTVDQKCQIYGPGPKLVRKSWAILCWELTYPHFKAFWVDDSPFPIARYVSSLEGTRVSQDL